MTKYSMTFTALADDRYYSHRFDVTDATLVVGGDFAAIAAREAGRFEAVLSAAEKAVTASEPHP